MEQPSFASLAYDNKKRKTRKKIFLSEMEAVLPWGLLLGPVLGLYPKSGRRGRQPFPAETMLRVYFMRQWFNLSDPAMEDALYNVESMRRFAVLSIEDRIPDETTILNFRHSLEDHNLVESNARSSRASCRTRSCGYRRARSSMRRSSTRRRRPRTKRKSVTPR